MSAAGARPRDIARLSWWVVTGARRGTLMGLLADLALIVLAQYVSLRCLSGLMHVDPGGAQRDVTLLLLCLSGGLTYHRLLALQRHCTGAFHADAHRWTVQLVTRFGALDLADVERLERSDVAVTLTGDMDAYGRLGVRVSGVLTGFLGAAISVAYVLSVSGTAAVIAASGLGLLTLNAAHTLTTTIAERRAQRRLWRRFTALVDHLVDGFREVKLNRARGDALLTDIERAEGELAGARLAVEAARTRGVLRQTSGRLTVLVIVGFGAALWADGAGTASVLMTAVLFGLRFVNQLSRQTVRLIAGQDVLERLQAFEARLPAAAPASPPTSTPATVAELRLDGLRFCYPADGMRAPFELGPIDFTARAGRATFIVGRNGSGKSTLLKTLVGLYAPTGGRVLVDGRPSPFGQAHRELFGVVLADPMVHARLHGLDDVPRATLVELAERLELSGKITVEGDRLSTTALSTGQRKRLGMLYALARPHPIVVFDEWAADQDPRFRRAFYTEWLPMLKRQGKVVIVISHDDAYFDHADDRIELRDGRMVT